MIQPLRGAAAASTMAPLCAESVHYSNNNKIRNEWERCQYINVWEDKWLAPAGLTCPPLYPPLVGVHSHSQRFYSRDPPHSPVSALQAWTWTKVPCIPIWKQNFKVDWVGIPDYSTKHSFGRLDQPGNWGGQGGQAEVGFTLSKCECNFALDQQRNPTHSV